MRETQPAWSNHPVDIVNGSIMDHHLLSYKATLNMQLKQYGNAVQIIDNQIERYEDLVQNHVETDDSGVYQDVLRASHINDYVQMLYRFELLGEGMGDRWERVLSLFRHTSSPLITPIDALYRILLFSVTKQEAFLQDLLRKDAAEEQTELWDSLQLRGVARILSS